MPDPECLKALRCEQVREVGHRQQQRDGVRDPQGGERERSRGDADLPGDRQCDRRQQHRGVAVRRPCGSMVAMLSIYVCTQIRMVHPQTQQFARRSKCSALMDRERSVVERAEEVGQAPPVVSLHLTNLRMAPPRPPRLRRAQ